MNKGFIFLAFSLGAAIGSAVAWKVTKTKYERIAQEEVDTMREYYFNKRKENADEVLADTEKTSEEPKEESEDVDRRAYRNITKIYKSDEDKEYERGPYVISPEEFDTLDDYEIESLTYWADEALTDDYGNLVEDIEAMVGYDSLTHFGEYEDDSVFVRNERYKTDYEILLDTRTWVDYQKTRTVK